MSKPPSSKATPRSRLNALEQLSPSALDWIAASLGFAVPARAADRSFARAVTRETLRGMVEADDASATELFDEFAQDHDMGGLT